MAGTKPLSTKEWKIAKLKNHPQPADTFGNVPHRGTRSTGGERAGPRQDRSYVESALRRDPLRACLTATPRRNCSQHFCRRLVLNSYLAVGVGGRGDVDSTGLPATSLASTTAFGDVSPTGGGRRGG